MAEAVSKKEWMKAEFHRLVSAYSEAFLPIDELPRAS